MTATETASALDDALISVWRQALVEQKKIITAAIQPSPFAEPPNITWRKLILKWMASNFAHWNKIRKPNPAGQKWPGKAQKSCSFCEQADT